MRREALQKVEARLSSRGTSCFANVLSSTAWPVASAGIHPRSPRASALAKPVIQVLLYECVILQMRIRSANPVDFFDLAGRKVFVRIETPASFEQPLTPQDLMNSRNT